MSTILCVDTNIVLRFLLKDSPLHLRAKQLFSEAEAGKSQIYFDEVVVAEVVWVLTSFYKIEKEVIAGDLTKLISQKWIVNPRKKIIIEAMAYFAATNTSFVDSWVLAVSKKKELMLTTFDKKLLRVSRNN